MAMMPDRDDMPLFTLVSDVISTRFPHRTIVELIAFTDDVVCVVLDGGSTKYVHRDGRVIPDDFRVLR
jgi:hypothetical protein